MRLLCLDLSLHCGWAVLDEAIGGKVTLVDHGTIHYKGNSAKSMSENYPWSYLDISREQIENISPLWMSKFKPNAIIVEETNKGKNRYSQKILEFLHHELLTRLHDFKSLGNYKVHYKVHYLDTSHWRSILGIWMSKEQKKVNAKISKAKREGGDVEARKVKKALGVRGKTNKKHIAIEHANTTFDLKLKMKENDAADAICLGLAYFKGATPSNGV